MRNRLRMVNGMTTTHAARISSEITADFRSAKADMAAAGIRDIIHVMEWQNGMCEVSGRFCSGRFGTGYVNKTLVEWAKNKFKTGSLKQINVSQIQGRKVTTYQVK